LYTRPIGRQKLAKSTLIFRVRSLYYHFFKSPSESFWEPKSLNARKVSFLIENDGFRLGTFIIPDWAMLESDSSSTPQQSTTELLLDD
jgi:hypothetical protein